MQKLGIRRSSQLPSSLPRSSPTALSSHFVHTRVPMCRFVLSVVMDVCSDHLSSQSLDSSFGDRCGRRYLICRLCVMRGTASELIVWVCLARTSQRPNFKRRAPACWSCSSSAFLLLRPSQLAGAQGIGCHTVVYSVSSISVPSLCDEFLAVHQSDASDDKYPGSLYTLEDPDHYYLCDRSSDETLTSIHSECPGLL